MGIDVNLFSKSYAVKRLDKSDIDMCFELMKKNNSFYEYHPPFVTKESILEDMQALPPHKGYEDKYYVGFFDGRALIAIMDLILAYPTAETAYIGFFMTEVQCQNKGLGSSIIREVCTYLKSSGYKKIRLGVDKGNPQSYSFWIKNRFDVVDENKYLIMELTL